MKSCLPIIALLISCFYSSSPIFAQKNFKPGFVVVGQQDTLRGFINYRNWSRNPGSVEFKNTIESAPRLYDITEISSFQVENESYIKATVMIDISSMNLNTLPTSPIPQMKQVTAFLRILIKGSKSLYYLADRDAKKHLFIYHDGKYELLVNYRYMQASESAGIVEVKRFKEQVQNYLDDCLSLRKEILSLKYEANSLIALFQKYYNCNDTKPSYIADREHLQTQIGVLGGPTISKISLNEYAFGYPGKIHFKASYIPSFGAFVNVTFPRTRKKLSLDNEPIFTFLKTSEYSMNDPNGGSFKSSNLIFSFNYLKLNNILRYRLLGNNSNVLLGAGISNGYMISHKSYNQVTGKEVFNTFRKYEQGIIFALGSEFKKIRIDLRYERSNGFSWYTNVGTYAQRFYFLLSYQLAK